MLHGAIAEERRQIFARTESPPGMLRESKWAYVGWKIDSVEAANRMKACISSGSRFWDSREYPKSGDHAELMTCAHTSTDRALVRVNVGVQYAGALDNRTLAEVTMQRCKSAKGQMRSILVRKIMPQASVLRQRQCKSQ